MHGGHGDTAGQRVAAKRRAVLARADVQHDLRIASASEYEKERQTNKCDRIR